MKLELASWRDAGLSLGENSRLHRPRCNRLNLVKPPRRPKIVQDDEYMAAINLAGLSHLPYPICYSGSRSMRSLVLFASFASFAVQGF